MLSENKGSGFDAVICWSFSFCLQQGDVHTNEEVKLSVQNAAEGRDDVCFITLLQTEQRKCLLVLLWGNVGVCV